MCRQCPAEKNGRGRGEQTKQKYNQKLTTLLSEQKKKQIHCVRLTNTEMHSNL
jgi:hypothetical protein